MGKTCFIGFLWLVVSGTCTAQKHIEHQQLIWYAYFNTIHFDTTWSLTTELQERRFINPGAQHQFLVRTHLHRNLGAGWDVAAGLCLLFHNPNDPESDLQLTVPEIRPHLEFNLRQKIKSLRIEHRYRVEARFLHNTDLSLMELEDGYTYGSLRFRYRLQLLLPVVRLSETQSIKLKASDEIFLNVGENIVHNFFDHNRLFAGLNMVVSPTFTVEVGYINWFQQRSSGVDYYNRDILQLALYQTIQ
jgi:hypothetical protein